MAFYTTIGVPGAIAAGIFFTGVTGYVLLEDVWRGAPFTTKHLMTIAVLMGTIYYGHRFQLQVRMWKLWTAAGCAALFLGGTVLCVSLSAGRNAQVITSKVQSANAVNSGRASAQKDRDEARIRYQAALKAEEDECSSGSGSKCQSKRITRMVRREEYDATEGKLREQRPEQVANADIKHAAELFARLPYVSADVRSVEALLLLMEPFLMSLFCEIGAILGFGIGLGHGTKALPVARPGKVSGKVSTVSKPRKPFQHQERVPESFPGPVERVPEAGAVLAVLERVGRPVTNVELAQLLGCSEGESSKRVAAMNGTISKVKVGRCVSISLNRRH